MEARSLCTRLWLLLLAVHVQNCCYAQRDDAAFPHINPNRLQFFEYDSIFVNCKKLDSSSEWRVMRKLKEDSTNTTRWGKSTGAISINLAFTSDSGEYWCENEKGERSNSVNITVTAGDVILESPAVPVMEGDTVSLYCRNKRTASNIPADFYKDGLLSATGYKGNFTIDGVSESHEGLYRCSISGAGDSAESWLAVRAHITLSPEESQESPETSSSNGSPHLFIILSVGFTILCLALLLLVVGLIHCRRKEVGCFSSEATTPGTDSVPGEGSVADPNMVTYAVVTKHRKKIDPGSSSCSARQTSSAGVRPNLRDNVAIYSTVQCY
ncbi:low affinity immunoglobulin gamma Fc region receptor II-a-like [Dicentrarchus labrax]|uniref:low affinity immunoglobulin gamma Fc region receptor II-a-like n=1 Tax=Dicentrarchus labrax TaxID=13489 RepID=UPI0021F604D9|nr:low affinity immunoglobulin gamma Fc region receptor II-a-like [Dicentrarchus labrax]